ncbi:WAP-type 'four-disulfide core, partial [Oesophagostomum dentatum]
SKTSGYCSQFKSDGGVCCPGQEPVWSPGTCPHGILSNGDCFRHCVVDEECASGQKCCFNGCGMSCVAALFSAPPSLSIHIGECLPAKSLGAFCVQRSKESECSEDTDCLPLRKCCSDGCVRRCTFPDITTHCIHARLAALAIRDYDSSGFVPECDSSGDYQQIQSHYGLKWCVDKHGKEIPDNAAIMKDVLSVTALCHANWSNVRRGSYVEWSNLDATRKAVLPFQDVYLTPVHLGNRSFQKELGC